MREKTVYPENCPHCNKSIAHLRPVGERTLDAARALLLPDISTSRDVANYLHISIPNAGMLLHRAVEANLISKVRRVTAHNLGGAAYEYQPSQRMASYAPTAYRAWANRQRIERNKIA